MSPSVRGAPSRSIGSTLKRRSTAGIAVCMLGHGHPGLADAIAAQARRLLHVSNLYYSEQQLQLAEALFQRAFQGRVFFCNSGAEANEAALKLARRYQIVTRGKG